MEHEDWNSRNDLLDQNDQEVPRAPSTEDLSQSVADWWQWGSVESQKIEQSSMYHSSPQKPTVENLSLSSSYTSAGRPSLVDYTERTPEVLVGGWPEFQLESSMDQMDDIFSNSLVGEYIENPFGSLQMFPDTLYKSLSFDNPWMDMLIDPRTPVKDSTRKENSACIGTSSYTLSDTILSEDWSKADDRSPSCSMPSECHRLEDFKGLDFTTFAPAELIVTNESKAIDEDGLRSSEEMMLQELEVGMIQLNKSIRICFRDALYRLATNSKEQQTTSLRTPGFSDQFSVPDIDSGSFRMDRCSESKTNAIDRTVAKFMFSFPCHDLQDLSSAAVTIRKCKETCNS